MSSPIKLNIERYTWFGLSASVLLHAVIFAAAAMLIKVSTGKENSHALYLQVITTEKIINPVENNIASEEKKALKEKQIIKPEKDAVPAAAYFTFNNQNTDTSKLSNVYNESTLNVSIKYPSGWAYLDQNVGTKLDGVTFLAVQGDYNPPPYVHLAVQDKELFNPVRYQYKLESENYIAFYNDPEEISEQVSQIFYIRTETDEDYLIKFIMKGKENFKQLQPTFFGMIKTFKFGKSFF